MTRRTSTLVAILTMASAFAATAQAQTNQVHIGARLSYHFDADAAGLGVQMGIPLARHLEFYPSIDNYFVKVGSFLSFNGDLKFRVPLETSEWLYLGTGVNLARHSYRDVNTTRTGVNLFVGGESLIGRVHPFGEFRFISNNGTSAQAVVGLNFTMHD